MTHHSPNSPTLFSNADPPVQPKTHPHPKLLFTFSCAIAAATIAVDVISKQLALQFLDTDSRIPLLGDLFGLQLAFNTGAAFSIGSELTPFITLLGLIATVLLVRAALRTRHRVYAAAIGLTLGGALGNIADRVFAPPGLGSGAVTDFLAYGNLFIGNIADIAIGAGVAIYAFGAWRLHANSRNRSTIDPNSGHDSESPALDFPAPPAEKAQP